MKTLKQRSIESSFIANTPMARLFGYAIKKKSFHTFSNYPYNVDKYVVASNELYTILTEKINIDFEFINKFEIQNNMREKNMLLIAQLEYVDKMEDKLDEYIITPQFLKIYNNLYRKNRKKIDTSFIQLGNIALSLKAFKIIIFSSKITKTNKILICTINNRLIYIKVEKFKFVFLPLINKTINK